MQSNKVILFQLVLVACLVGYVLSATTDESGKMKPLKPGDRHHDMCRNCQNVAEYLKEAMPEAKYALKRICRNYWFDHNRGNCEQAVERITNEITQKSTYQLCTEFGLCKGHEAEKRENAI